jgi:hypothetical protein
MSNHSVKYGLPDSSDTIDPSVFGDSVAMQTDWTYIEENGGSNTFQKYKLIKINVYRLEFQAIDRKIAA